MAERVVEAVLFDVNETLFSMRPLGQVFGEVGLDPAAVPLWFVRLRGAGLAAATLTNSSAEMVQGLLERAGLAGYLRANLSVEQVGRWKPAPQPYQAAATRLGVEPSRLALVGSVCS
jgi:2-haloacid dehalogenase